LSAAVRPPPVEPAEELPVRSFLERLPVVRARDGRGCSLGSGFVGELSGDVDELLPGDDATSSVKSVSGWVAPAATVIFGIPVSS
jgi:hypothetical protein